jgi:hypothetical protein
MATTKKPAAKAIAPKAIAKAPKETSNMFNMPQEVKDWIERAQSIMSHQRGEIDRLKEENKALKAYRQFAEHRILRSEAE